MKTNSEITEDQWVAEMARLAQPEKIPQGFKKLNEWAVIFKINPNTLTFRFKKLVAAKQLEVREFRGRQHKYYRPIKQRTTKP